MPEYGLTDDGMETPSYNEIVNFLAQKWKEERGQSVDLSSRSPEGQFIRVNALMMSNTGMEWSEIESLWDVALDVYYSAYVSTATGVSLDNAVDRRGLTRKSALNAKGTVVFEGAEGSEVPINTTVQTSSGIEFVTTRSATVGPYGIVSVPVQAVESGSEGNIVENTITQSEVLSASNPTETHTRILGSNIDYWDSVDNDNSLTKYQLFNTEDAKYITNVHELSFTIQAESAGLYALRIVLLNHTSGQVIDRTETREVNLKEGEKEEITFTGQDFDLAEPGVDDTVRFAIQNHDYSVDNFKVALDSDSPYPEWHHGTASQGRALTMAVKSRVVGDFSGGRDSETDEELRTRYQKELDRGGGNRVSAMEAELYEITGVKHAEVYENETHHDLRDQGGLPPHSIEVVVWGGGKEEILKVLLSEKTAGTNTWGNRVGTITDDQGQTHTFRWSRAEEVELYINLDLVTGANFPANGAKKVRDLCAEVVGGENTEGSFLDGQIDLGGTVYQSEIESTLHEEINGLRSVSSTLGLDSDNMVDGNIDLEDRQTAIVRPDNITIVS